MENKLMVLTGLDYFGRVIVLFEDRTKMGSHGYTSSAYKVQSNKKGDFIVVNKKRYYIEVPQGEWKLPYGQTGGTPCWYPSEPIQYAETKRYMECDTCESTRRIADEKGYSKMCPTCCSKGGF